MESETEIGGEREREKCSQVEAQLLYKMVEMEWKF
jgi:hypothetical protein